MYYYIDLSPGFHRSTRLYCRLPAVPTERLGIPTGALWHHSRPGSPLDVRRHRPGGSPPPKGTAGRTGGHQAGPGGILWQEDTPFLQDQQRAQQFSRSTWAAEVHREQRHASEVFAGLGRYPPARVGPTGHAVQLSGQGHVIQAVLAGGAFRGAGPHGRTAGGQGRAPLPRVKARSQRLVNVKGALYWIHS